MANAYPLQWPEGWKRSSGRQSSRYKTTRDKAIAELVKELIAFGASRDSIVISTNIRTGLGSRMNDPVDPGVAVYWVTRQYGERVLACDKWATVAENVRAIGKAVEALRMLERSGASQVLDRAFSAFGALPGSVDAAKTRPWWEVLGLTQDIAVSLSLGMIQARYRELAAKAHPDRNGGSTESMNELNRAIEEAKTHFAK